MGEDTLAKNKLVGQLLLGGLGVLLFAAGAWGYFRGPNDKLAGGLFVLAGIVLVVLAAFYSRLDGIVELGLLKTPMAKARRAERQVDQGLVVAGNHLDDARKALEGALAGYHGYGPPRPARNVLLAEDAVFSIATLPHHEQVLVRAEVARMGMLDFRPDLDLRATRPSDDERPYLMHRVPGSGIRLWYRQKGEADPYTLYVMVIEKHG